MAHFSGTLGYHSTHPGLILTDGAIHVCREGQAYWLADIFWSLTSKVHRVGWAFAIFTVANGAATFELRDDTGPDSRQLHFQVIPFTNFPVEGAIKFYAEQHHTDIVVMLASEY